MSRLYNPELPITVEVDSQGRPAALTWQRREPVRVPISRMSYVVTTPTMLLEVYEDLCTGDWYRQRVIDKLRRRERERAARDDRGPLAPREGHQA